MIDPKFEAHLKLYARDWQFSPHGTFKFGECPECGKIAQSFGDSPVHGSDFEREHSFECECGCEFYFITTTAYKYGGIAAGD